MDVRVKRPSPVLTEDREYPRSSLETVTLAAAKELPEGSKIAPRISPEVLVAWEKSSLVSRTKQANERELNMNRMLHDEKFIGP